MDVTYAAPSITRRSLAVAARTAVASLGSFVVEVVLDGIRGHDLERTFASAPGAQFAALPSVSQQRLLDRGYRP